MLVERHLNDYILTDYRHQHSPWLVTNLRIHDKYLRFNANELRAACVRKMRADFVVVVVCVGGLCVRVCVCGRRTRLSRNTRCDFQESEHRPIHGLSIFTINICKLSSAHSHVNIQTCACVRVCVLTI